MTTAHPLGVNLEERVLLYPPTRRDGEVTCALLARAEVHCLASPSLQVLAAQMEDGVGALVLTDHALTDPGMAAVLALLGRQPAWSDVPALLLTRDREHSPAATRVLGMFTNVTLLDRPVSTRSMVSAVLAALRARRRQYQIRDQMTEQWRAEQALRDADQRKDEFLATLAHELRNPLAPIRTGLHVLTRLPSGSAPPERLLGMMERQLGQLVKLIDELLDVSRIATGKVVLRRERVDMRAVVDAALEGSQPGIDAARHTVRVELPDEPLWVVGDASRLAQVVSNLLNNAAKYTPDSGRIDVALSEEAGQAVVRVTDNGAGIPPEMLEHVFAMFTQVNRTLDRAQGGVGIGLSLVRRLMELHGGNVSAASAGLECGSSFTVRLPAVAAEPVRPAPLQAQSPPVANTQPQLRRVRVLVVDDNADAADALTILLESNGHITRTEYSGAAALRAANEFEPDVVFCDVGLPGMDGHEVARRLRRDRRHASTVLVALTGWGSEDDKRRTRSAGFDFHLTKPVSAETVDEILSGLKTLPKPTTISSC